MAIFDLPDIEFVSDDVTATLNNMVTVVEALEGRTLAPADPLRLFLQALAVLIVQQRKLINLVGRADLLRYAPTDILDHMGAFTDTERLPSKAAVSTVRFTLSAPQMSALSIPAGTRVSTTTDPKVYFATGVYAEVPPGALHVDVEVTCTDAGVDGNGYLPGQINNLVDPIAYVADVSNLTESAGGADTESDDAFRERIRNAPEAFSVAGPSGAYAYWAKTANPAIIDVSVSSPAPTEVLIVPLLTGGEIPGQEVLDAVGDICSADTVRPLTDKVTVAAPEDVTYAVSLTYWIHAGNASDVAAIQAAVHAEVNAYVLWQKSKLGRDINPSELIRRVMSAGAYRVDVNSPVYVEVGVTQVAIAGDVKAVYGGLVHD